MSNFAEIANSFVSFYYQKFDTDRAGLLPLYSDVSMLSYEGETFVGAAKIVEKLSSLRFQKIAHAITTVDAQPSHPQAGSVLITVMGQLKIDDEPHPFNFIQTFNLYPNASGYFVYNDAETNNLLLTADIFRLVVHNG
ncbi:Nuclear transport factor 2 [Dinochytrium kinnereticum]|nr:Nuclear transport factor 2 [Dinochytrium kinnereticum]